MIALLEFAALKHDSILKEIRGCFRAMKIRDQVYRKPVNHMEKLENTLLRLISEIENQRIWYDED